MLRSLVFAGLVFNVGARPRLELKLARSSTGESFSCDLAVLQGYASPPVARAGRAGNVTVEVSLSAGCAGAPPAGLTATIELPPDVSAPSAPTLSTLLDGVLVLTWQGVVAPAPGPVAGNALVTLSAPSGATATANFSVTWIKALSAPVPQTRYAPPPAVPDTGTYEIHVIACPIWAGRKAWSPLLPFREREPALSFYDDGDPRVVDWQLSWLLTAGVKVTWIVWYRQLGNNGETPVLATLDHWLRRGFLGGQSRYAPQMQFAILWDNQNSCCAGLGSNSTSARDDLLDNLVPFWIGQYLNRDNYFRTSGFAFESAAPPAPVIGIFDADTFVADLGGPAAALSALGAADALAKSRGLPGLRFAAQWCWGDTSETRPVQAEAGFAFSFGYHWPTFSVLAEGVPGGLRPDARGMLEIEPNCSAGQDLFSSAAAIPNIQTISPSWDDRPWNPLPGNSNRLWKADALSYAAAALAARSELDARRAQPFSPPLRGAALFVDNLDEFGEGHFVSPHRELGFAQLAALRAAFAGVGDEDVFLLPEDVGLPFDEFTTCFASGSDAPECTQ